MIKHARLGLGLRIKKIVFYVIIRTITAENKSIWHGNYSTIIVSCLFRLPINYVVNS